MKRDWEIKRLFSDVEFIGTVLRYCTLLELALDCLLTQFFFRQDRLYEGLTLVISDIPFGRKIGLLENLPIREGVISYERAKEGLRHFQRVRNLAAHKVDVPKKTVQDLLADDMYRTMLGHYPDGMATVLRQTQHALSRLTRIKEFATDYPVDAIDPLRIILDGMFS